VAHRFLGSHRRSAQSPASLSEQDARSPPRRPAPRHGDVGMPRNRAMTASESPQQPLRDENRLLEELVAVINIAVSDFLFVSFYAYQAGLNLEMGGRVGYGLASAVVQALGLAAYLIPVA